MSIRTDLAMENEKLILEKLPKGVTLEKEDVENTHIDVLKIIDEIGAKALSKAKGIYITATIPKFSGSTFLSENEMGKLAEILRKLLPIEKTVLVVGLGNVHITPDAIGPKTIDLILATRHLTEKAVKPLEYFRSVAAIATGVLGQTGIETAEIIASIVKEIKPAAIIVVDALACADVKRLGTTIQISDTGISPGSGVQNKRQELSKNTIGVPVVAIGVPTVVDNKTIAEDLTENAIKNGENEIFMVTPRDVDLLIERASKTISVIINMALQENFSANDIDSLTR